jgi:hypothetical protein
VSGGRKVPYLPDPDDHLIQLEQTTISAEPHRR